MRSVGGDNDLTFIERARRAQIVGAAIETIAELGYGQASLARIAERAGIGKGVIAYHFAGKEEMVGAVIAEVLATAEEYMRPRLEALPPGAALLRGYIECNLAFMREYPGHVIALAEIARNARAADGNRLFDSSHVAAWRAGLAELLARLQSEGALREDFDPRVVATAIRAAIDAAAQRLAQEHEFDFDHYGQELANLFELATRAPQRPRRRG